MRQMSFATACVLAGVLAVAIPATSQAQAKKGTFTGAAEVGARAFTTEPADKDKGKLEEYRSLPAGALLERARLEYLPADGYGTYQLTLRRLGQLDQSMWLQASRPGLYNFNIRYDRIPHLYSSTGRSPGNEGAAALGFNTLPSSRPDSTAWKNAPYIGNIRTIWSPIKATLDYAFSEAADFKADFVTIGKKGGLPKSISFNGSSGPQREYVSPIDETVNNFKVSQSYASGLRDKNSFLGDILTSYQGTVSYEYSKYDNAISSVMVDNPALSTAAWATTMPSTTIWGTNTARVSVAPNNTASTMSLVGAIGLPFRTRVTGSVNTSSQEQNDAYLPQFNNAALQAAPNVALTALQRPSLQGKVKLTTVNFTATSHPIAHLTLGAKYRNHSYSNQTPADSTLAWARSDRQIDATAEHTEWDPFTKVNSDVSAAYELARNASVAVGYAVEDFTREPGVYSVDGTREKAPRFSVDYSGLSWLSLHSSYTTSQRRYYGKYRETSIEVSGNRKFFMADRDRTRTNVMATVTPVDQVSVGLSYIVGDDTYPNSPFGMQSDKSTTTGLDVDWTPTSRVSVSAGYSKENVDNMTRYRYRAVNSVTSPLFDNPLFYFSSTNKDENTTTFAAVNAVLIPEKLVVKANLSVIDGTFHLLNNNYNGSPAGAAAQGATAAQILTATAEDWPEVSSKLTPFSLALQYQYTANWGFTLRFNSETYTNHNWQQEAPLFTTTGVLGGPPMTTYWTSTNLPGNIGAVCTTAGNASCATGQYHFLGNNYNNYKASWLTFTVSWHPKSLPLDRGRASF